MQISTTIPVRSQSIPKRARVVSVYATACNPLTGQLARVRVQAIRTVRDVTPVCFKVADVQELSPRVSLGFSVRVEELKGITAFIVQEV